MNKRMRELRALIEAKVKEARSLLAGENKDVEKATAIMNEVDGLETEFEVEKKIFEAEKDGVEEEAEKAAEDKAEKNANAEFAKAARAGFPKAMSEGSNPDGGYTVPEDIVTKIERYRDAKFSLRSLVRVVPVSTKSGARTFKKRFTRTGFAKVLENGKFAAKQTPQFERLTYSITKYGGYFVMTNELIEDSDENIVNLVTEDIGEEARVTDNVQILGVLGNETNFPKVNLEGLPGIKHAVNVTLGQAFADTSAIVTNDNGLQYLDTLTDEEGRALLKMSPTDPLKQYVAIGFKLIPLHVLPNNDLPNTELFDLTTDQTVVSGKTYYTRSGSAGAYVYTPVETPSAESLSSYYEKTEAYPFIIGDLAEAVVLWDRRQITLLQSNVASVGSGDDAYNAFEQGGSIIRADMRADYTARDTAAAVVGYIIPAEG